MLIWQEHIACFLAIHHIARGYWTLALALPVVSSISSRRPYKKFPNSFSPPTPCALWLIVSAMFRLVQLKKSCPGFSRIQNMQNWKLLSNRDPYRNNCVVYNCVCLVLHWVIVFKIKQSIENLSNFRALWILDFFNLDLTSLITSVYIFLLSMELPSSCYCVTRLPHRSTKLLMLLYICIYYIYIYHIILYFIFFRYIINHFSMYKL